MTDEEKKAHEELLVMLRSLTGSSEEFFTLGLFKAKRKLSNGAVVQFSIKQPPLKKASR